MKLNSKLWMLAVALATVGCQDDLDKGSTTGGGVELKGEKALIQVAVNAGTTTRAADPTPGEEGDGDEAGTIEESKVHDVTVFLFRNDDNPTTDFEFKNTSTIYAAGYVADDGSMSAGSTEHSFYKEVEISGLYPNATLVDGNPYGVIAVTNLGGQGANMLMAAIMPASESDANKTGADLANYIQKSYGNAKSGFVMSTHKMKVGSDESTVIPVNITSTEDAPSVNVYVERLAAKIRINEFKDNNFVYNVEKREGDVAILNNVAIVNQLANGEYVIKRVTENTDADLSFTDVANDIYLGDEIESTAAKNFVIDPWTRSKAVIPDGGTMSVADLYYINPYMGSSMSAMWETLSGKTQLYNNASFTSKDQLDLCYTMENTTSVVASQNGYSTGAIFEATYYPGSWMIASTTTENGTAEETNSYKVEGEVTTYTAADFYIYQNAVFKDKAAIFAYALAKVIPAGTKEKVYTYKDFAGGELASDFSLETFKTSYSASATDPFGYVAYLNSLSNDTPVSDISTFEKFMDSENPHLVKDPASVEFHEKGRTFYPFWFRHANNDNPKEMGIMEFGIVRNNIYDLTVNGIKGYGEVEAPNPGEPDEHTQVGINVVLYVKDWTLRTNDNIYL